ncbi:MAG: translation elongation factor Ts [Clostridia bacterium]|nr:translation elongation factor Ts [Clostridia bacterium]MDY5264733.1 translation elongation factor Ts [Eubacteriales bacterium]MDY5439745.1 translation elongation factor Ts [Eubacteriales bacterium]
MFTNKDIMKLREQTGVGIMKCKEALIETDGDFEKAVAYLREKGMASAEKRASKIASQGVVDSYIHMGGKVGVLVEVNCETDFVARGEKFKEFVHDVAMQIAAAKPLYVRSSEVPTEELEKEKEILRAQALNEGKPEKIVDRMVEGRVKKYYEEFCLLDQKFVKDPSKTIEEYLKETISVIGEKIDIRRFVRYEMGEGLEKKEENFAQEIADQIAAAKKA